MLLIKTALGGKIFVMNRSLQCIQLLLFVLGRVLPLNQSFTFVVGSRLGLQRCAQLGVRNRGTLLFVSTPGDNVEKVVFAIKKQ